jgi:hypothetical protein
MFGWAVECELLPIQVHQPLKRVEGLRKGRSASRETTPVEPVPEAALRAILPHLSPSVAAMVQQQHLSGARPQEFVAIRPCEVTTDGDDWLHQPRSHKTAHLGRAKVIVLGPRAREGLRPCCFIAYHRAWRDETGDSVEQAFDRSKTTGRSEVASLR